MGKYPTYLAMLEDHETGGSKPKRVFRQGFSQDERKEGKENGDQATAEQIQEEDTDADEDTQVNLGFKIAEVEIRLNE